MTKKEPILHRPILLPKMYRLRKPGSGRRKRLKCSGFVYLQGGGELKGALQIFTKVLPRKVKILAVLASKVAHSIVLSERKP